jgi:hypothetical protein
MLANEGFVFLIGSSDRGLIGFLGFQNAQAGNEPGNLADCPLGLAGRLFRWRPWARRVWPAGPCVSVWLSSCRLQLASKDLAVSKCPGLAAGCILTRNACAAWKHALSIGNSLAGQVEQVCRELLLVSAQQNVGRRRRAVMGSSCGRAVIGAVGFGSRRLQLIRHEGHRVVDSIRSSSVANFSARSRQDHPRRLPWPQNSRPPSKGRALVSVNSMLKFPSLLLQISRKTPAGNPARACDYAASP